MRLARHLQKCKALVRGGENVDSLDTIHEALLGKVLQVSFCYLADMLMIYVSPIRVVCVLCVELVMC